jgi:two-component system NtrC family sensor kinase
MEVLSECAAGLERLLGFYETAALPASLIAQSVQIKEEIDYERTLADMRSGIADCHSGAERIRDVVQNLRVFSRLDEAEFKKVDIHEGIDSTIRLLSRYYTSDSVTLRRDYGELPPVDCYAGQLNQMWMNLLVNAAQAISSDGGEVRVATRLEVEAVRVSISDTGGGIAPEYLNQIFNPFFTTKPVGEGTGLGLSIVHKILKGHGGSIKVRTTPKKGSVFTLTLPLDGAAAIKPVPAAVTA